MIRGLNVIFIGPAGCGKTSLTKAFGEWSERELGMTIAYVNLDPGVLNLPYKPDYDVRELVTVHRLMLEEGLGPNGAMIKASEIMDENIGSIAEKIASLDADLRLIDTPGQMELFLFRPMGPRLSEAISKNSPSITVYISDPSLASSPSGLAISLPMALITWFRLSTPTVPVINKIDALEGGLEKLLMDPSMLKKSLLMEEGLIADLATEYMSLVEELLKSMRIVEVSAKTGEGMSALYDLIHEALCECGDLS